ncbi:hypothetical protein DDZ16_13110 [Marinilabilia rubra]|uniref:Uncharacterized protein n=1 Tax=Marinilabilia rubra TaxID=2162893 RepID=A0A2U2B772_9BACT|nr:hypothetical protein DDZ16_13110 [Marinilabilia rubra]
MQDYSTSNSDFFALNHKKTANQKNKIYCTARISKYFNTPSIGRLVNFALLTFSAVPSMLINEQILRQAKNDIKFGFFGQPLF